MYFFSLLALATACNNKSDIMSQFPKAEKIEKKLVEHGHTRIDNYYWLNDRENQKVIDYLNAENDYTEAVLADVKDLKNKLFNEIKGRMKQTDLSVPFKYNGYYYYNRFEEGKEYPIFCRKANDLTSQEEILLDANKMAEGKTYYQAGGFEISPNNKILAYAEDTVGRRKYTIRFIDLESGNFLKDNILNTSGDIAWANDNKTVFYTTIDEALRPFKVFKHVLKQELSSDMEIFHETDATFNVNCYRSKSGQYVFIASSSTVSDEYHYIDADKVDEGIKTIQPRERGLEYSVEHYKEHFYIRTNWNALNFKIMKTSVEKPSKENWQELIGHRENVLIEGFVLFSKFLAVLERTDALTKLHIYNWNDGSDHYIDFNEEVYATDFNVNRDMESDVLRFTYTSLTTPISVYDYNMNIKEKELLKIQEVIGNYDATQYQAERLWAEAEDGTKIPISLVYKKGMRKDTGNPAVLYAYGSYGSSTDPYFSISRLSLLDRGFVYAIAHVRGGEEMGRQWYEDGKLLKKKNTFTDFIACADFLIKQKYSNSEELFAWGGSAGGLLVGAVANMRPDLFKGIIAQVPFVDVVTTMLDESIPLTTGEFDEWGNPKNKEFYDYMLSYSPYDNVEAKNYPNMLVTTGLHDSQVQYWEPAKWVAKLRDVKTDRNILLLKTNMDAGHGGASGRFKSIEETALNYAFIMKLLNIKE